MTRRPGLSLTEVLVALFIMGIGTIAILTLFPLGALNMAQALRDDRTTQAAGQADAFLRWYVQEAKTDAINSTPNRLTGVTGNYERWYGALNDPGSASVSKYLIPTTGRAIPSYPVVIDPMGYVARGGAASFSGTGRGGWVGDAGFGNGDWAAYRHTSALPRFTLAMVNDTARAPTAADQRLFAQRVCTLLDGMGYDKGTGGPDTTSGAIDRDIRYNWLWVVQKADSTRAPATVTVVVFDRRAPMYAPAGSEEVYTPSFAQPGQTRISFRPGEVPPVQKGGWLMDATVVAADSTGRAFTNPSIKDGVGAFTEPTPPQPWIRNANFYRVASITEDPGTGGADVELDIPLKADVEPPRMGPTDNRLTPLPADYRRFIYLNGVCEVFVRQVPLDL